MGNRANRPTDHVAVLLSIDIEQSLSRSNGWYTVQLSVPGRDNTIERTWYAPSGRLEAPAVEDLSGYVQRCVHDALVMWGAVEDVPAL